MSDTERPPLQTSPVCFVRKRPPPRSVPGPPHVLIRGRVHCSRSRCFNIKTKKKKLPLFYSDFFPQIYRIIAFICLLYSNYNGRYFLTVVFVEWQLYLQLLDTHEHTVHWNRTHARTAGSRRHRGLPVSVGEGSIPSAAALRCLHPSWQREVTRVLEDDGHWAGIQVSGSQGDLLKRRIIQT